MSLPVKLERVASVLLTPLFLATAAIAQSAEPLAPVAPPAGSPLPEPLTWTLVGMAALGVGFATKRSKNSEDQADSTPTT